MKSETKLCGKYLNIKNGCIVCINNGIFKYAIFGLLTDKKKTHCSTHKEKDMIDLTHINNNCIVCDGKGKFKIACYGFLSDKRKTRCSKHKENGMINLQDINSGCVICTEFKRASYGFLNDKKKTRCSDHKENGMIDLNNINNNCIICAEEGREIKRATFGFLTDKRKTHCSEHKEKDMIDLVHMNSNCIVCTEEGKSRRASFRFLTDKKNTHCAKHREKGMVSPNDIQRSCTMCIAQGTIRRASFGFLTDQKKTRCSKHIEKDMINLVHMSDNCIVCTEEGEFRRASYGPLFEKKIHCFVHKRPNEYSHNKPTCVECTNIPYFGDEKEDQIPQRCEDHRLNTDVDMIRRKCILCGDEYFIPETLDKCRGCMGWELKKKYKVKERKIRTLLLSLVSILGKFIWDVIIKEGCSLKRPDFFYKDFNYCFHLILEVDEHQHSKYTCSIQGELYRLINIYENDCGGFPLCVVRFNPDPYYYNKTIQTIYKGREDTLKTVLLGLKTLTDFPYKIGIIYLYYDEFSAITAIKIEKLDYKTINGYMKITHKHPHSSEKTHKYLL